MNDSNSKNSDSDENSQISNKLPIIIYLIEKYISPLSNVSLKWKKLGYMTSVWMLTFITYLLFHLCRMPTSVIKGTLKGHCANISICNFSGSSNNTNNSVTCQCGWSPFNRSDGNTLLGGIDYAFLFTYAIAMFFSGHIADRVPLRHFITAGMLGSGVSVCLFGMAYYWQIHSYWYFICVQIVNGMFQSTGWPGVIGVMGHWFGEGNRGLLLGVWNMHTNLGNVLGAVIPGIWADSIWGWSFLSVGIAIITGAVIIFLSLVVDPTYLGLPPPIHHQQIDKDNNNSNDTDKGSHKISGNYDTEKTELFKNQDYKNRNDGNEIENGDKKKSINFFRALLIPGVVEYSLSLAFGKLVAYTFLFWLPLYIQNTEIGGYSFNAMTSADLSVIFDVGGIIGVITGGLVSDIIKSRSLVCIVLYLCGIPILYVYYAVGHTSLPLNIALLVVLGFLIYGPYGLITTAVTADLGTHPSLTGNTNAKSTVAAIIDGTGSIGGALGPLLAGWISNYGWNYVFYILMCSCFLATLFLTRLAMKDFVKYINLFRKRLNKL